MYRTFVCVCFYFIKWPISIWLEALTIGRSKCLHWLAVKGPIFLPVDGPQISGKGPDFGMHVTIEILVQDAVMHLHSTFVCDC